MRIFFQCAFIFFPMTICLYLVCVFLFWFKVHQIAKLMRPRNEQIEVILMLLKRITDFSQYVFSLLSVDLQLMLISVGLHIEAKGSIVKMLENWVLQIGDGVELCHHCRAVIVETFNT